jgi:hypothetical protein
MGVGNPKNALPTQGMNYLPFRPPFFLHIPITTFRF